MILIFVWTIKISVVTEETGASAGHVLQIRADHLQPVICYQSISVITPHQDNTTEEHWLTVIIIFSEVKIELSRGSAFFCILRTTYINDHPILYIACTRYISFTILHFINNKHHLLRTYKGSSII